MARSRYAGGIKDLATSKAVDEIDRRLDALERLVLSGGRLLTIPLASGTIKIPHGLGRRYIGFFSALGVDLDEDTTNTSPERELWVTATGYGSLTETKVWVF